MAIHGGYHIAFCSILPDMRASLVVQMVKNLLAMQETRVHPWVRKIPWRREWQPTPAFLPGEFHGQRSLMQSMGSQKARHN